MRKLFSLFLVLALLLSGCGSPAADGASSASLSLDGASSSAPLPEADTAEPADASFPENEPEAQPVPVPETFTPYHYALCFAGDISLVDGGSTVSALNSYGLEGCISETLLEAMRSADVMCLNSEFAFTDRGSPLPNKTYTFRSTPSRISVLRDMGTDVAVLANNHVYDYGEEGLLDTLQTFRDAGLPYIGAGETLEEASAIWYAELENCTVAYIAGSRVEWTMLTRGATDSSPGVFRTAESNELMVQRIQEAKQNADFVVVYQHWGQEGTTELEEYQTTSGKEWIDAGADVIVGDHPHVVQGIEWYNGKPIFYSMGNYWFTSTQERYTMLMEMDLDRDEEGSTSVSFRLIPAWTSNTKTTYLSDTNDQRAFYDYMEGISVNGEIADDGTLLNP